MISTLPTVKRTKRQKQLLNLVRALKELQGAKSHLIGAYSFCDKIELTEIGMHLRKITKDINTITQHLNNVYKKEPIVYNDIHSMYESLETVIGETE